MNTVQISFKEATSIAKNNLVELVENVTDITVEGIEHNTKYEVKLSYTIDSNLNTDNSGLGSLAKIMGRRRDVKLFKISDKGDFLGFSDAQKSNS
ncbi:hypothetical protein P256_02621 [Acinetobacter nectaris CIP 110549]|uniref:Uncharacterized protein n=1 Tax=Acinetobacter nectaris CIP 110549 TaxID=1392540 RepID=V2TAB7_9GAMM|nr:hypothetical protein [Acinetobacter nectaris]ESK34662.1 hypothetical protein P256_02621 [Acinetobacter nectaris CIP 110549]